MALHAPRPLKLLAVITALGCALLCSYLVATRPTRVTLGDVDGLAGDELVRALRRRERALDTPVCRVLLTTGLCNARPTLEALERAVGSGKRDVGGFAEAVVTDLNGGVAKHRHGVLIVLLGVGLVGLVGALAMAAGLYKTATQALLIAGASPAAADGQPSALILTAFLGVIIVAEWILLARTT